MPTLLAPPVRVRAAPALEPPYDDEAAEPLAAGRLAQPLLPLDWSTRSASRERRTPVRQAGAGHAAPAGPAVAARTAPPGQLAAVRFVNACVEVLGGYRPLAHLRQLVVPTQFAVVAEEISRARQRVVAAPALPRRATPVSPVRVRRLRLCEPRAGVVEAAAVLGHQDRRWALALRLECQPVGWRCTVAQTI